MNTLDYLAILRKRWITIAVITVMSLIPAGVITLLAEPVYEATTKLFFAVPGGDSATDLAQGSSFTEKQMSSYAEVATSPLVLDNVVETLELQGTGEKLSESVRATVPPNTVILEVTVSAPSPEAAASIANAIGARLAQVVSGLYPERSDQTQAVLATTLSSASAPLAPSSPSLRRNMAMALMFGILAGGIGALLRESLDTRVRNAADVSEVTDRAVLGLVNFDPEAPSHPIVMVDRPTSGRAESIRRLRTNLQFIHSELKPRSLLVTSSVAGEGKTTTAVNLAVALADAGSRVLLIDADLRRPSLQRTLGLDGSAGLTSVLIGRATADEVIQPWLGGRIDVMTSGPIPPNPSELLGSRAMVSLLKEVQAGYDVTVVDSAPLLPVTDAAILSARVDGTLLIVASGQTHRGQLRSALEALGSVGPGIVGIVINKAQSRDLVGYGSGYRYDSIDAPEAASTTSAVLTRRADLRTQQSAPRLRKSTSADEA